MADKLDDLRVCFPAHAGYLPISRLNATAMASSLGFDVEEMDDLRLAVGEAVTWLISAEEGVDRAATIELVVRCHADRLEFHAARTTTEDQEPGGARGPAWPDEMVEAILAATVDEREVGTDSRGRRYVTVVKYRSADGRGG